MGGELFGVGLLFMSLRSHVPDWMSYEMANFCIYAGNMLRIQTLRKDLHSPLSWPLLIGICIGLGLVYQAGRQVPDSGASMHFIWSAVVVSFQCLWIAQLAYRLAERERIATAKWLAIAYLPLAIALPMRAVQVATGAATPGLLIDDYLPLAIALSGMLAAVLGNTSFLGMFVERASRRQVQQARDQARREESDRLSQQIAHLDRQRGMGLLAASLAHELGQPLTNISLVTELGKLDSLQDFGPDSAYAQHFKDIQRNASNAIAIMERIRSYLRGRVSAHEDVQLQEVRDNVLLLMKDWLEQEQIEVTAPETACALQVQGDPVQLAQIVVNLLRNAGQACAGLPHKQIDIRLRREGDRAILEVQDNGPGFAPEVLHNNASTWYTTKREGLGIGLSISRHIAEQHQGSLTIGNAPEGGAVVTLSLPAH